METTQLELKQVANVVTEADQKAKREVSELQATLMGGIGGEFSLY